MIQPMINFDFQKAEQALLYKVIAGSRAYGLDLPTSDTDIRGIYFQPNEFRLGNGYKEQVNDQKKLKYKIEPYPKRVG